MLFNSWVFALFFAAVYPLYLVFDHRKQNLLLLAASYFFYGWWDWRFLSLLWLSTGVDYWCALEIDKSAEKGRRKFFLLLSIGTNLGVLGFFKYFNFFSANLQAVLGGLGLEFSPLALNIILPVGVSFYTFQTMSYVLDVYRRDLKPAKRLLDFALYISFFPQLVAGPIERATHLLPQVLGERRVTKEGVREGASLILWGLFQKVFVADSLARIVEPLFRTGPPYEGASVLLALYAFAFQIYCDFAGYSNIARGLGKCMGFDIMVNFNLPYFSTNPSEFWQRWHISLSTWLRDYLYIPLGGNRKGTVLTFRNLALTMFLGGLWHGAAWTFVLWGIYHGILLIAYRLAQPFTEKLSLPRFVRALFFFHLVCLGWLLFRAESLTQVFQMLEGLVFHFNPETLSWQSDLAALAFFTGILLVLEGAQYARKNLNLILTWRPLPRLAFYILLVHLMAVFSAPETKQFIYFQF